MIAAGHIGANASSRLHRVGGNRRNQFGPIFRPHQTVSQNRTTPIIANIHLRIERLASFVRQSRNLDQSRLLTSAPTVVATNSVARHSRANAGHRGCVSGR